MISARSGSIAPRDGAENTGTGPNSGNSPPRVSPGREGRHPRRPCAWPCVDRTWLPASDRSAQDDTGRRPRPHDPARRIPLARRERPTQRIRSKTRVLGTAGYRGRSDSPTSFRPGAFTTGVVDLPGRGAATSDLMLQPVNFRLTDPLRGRGNYLVMCEVTHADGRPHATEHPGAAARELLAPAAPRSRSRWIGVRAGVLPPVSRASDGRSASLRAGLPGPAGTVLTAAWAPTASSAATRRGTHTSACLDARLHDLRHRNGEVNARAVST